MGSAPRGRAAAGRPNYPGAIYGSVLAAAVIVGWSSGEEPLSPDELTVLLAVTGVVFWLTHAYARLLGAPERLALAEVGRVAVLEWSVAQASLIPAIAAALGAVFGLGSETVGWLALGVALAGLVGSVVLAARRAHAGVVVTATSGAVGLVLGLALAALKAVVEH